MVVILFNAAVVFCYTIFNSAVNQLIVKHAKGFLENKILQSIKNFS